MRTFEEYDQQIAFTVAQNNGHQDPLWALMECAGELGEVLSILMQYADFEEVVSGRSIDFYVSLNKCLGSLQDLEIRKKKFRREQNRPYDALVGADPQITPTPELLKELGGMLWGLNQLCKQCGTTLEEVATVNYQELRDRFERNPQWLLSKGVE